MPRNQRAKPRNVVVVDANDPMVEVEGEFYWREDHDVLMAAARRDAYAQGWADAMHAATTTQLTFRLKGPWYARLMWRLLLAALLVGVVSLLGAAVLR